jgi:hypothetical protein
VTDRIPTVYRPLAASDEPLFYSSWIESFRDSHYAGPYPYVVYHQAIRKSIELYRRRPGFRVMVAANRSDPDQVYGWMAYEHIADKQVIYYAYTKELFRKKGVLRGLARAAYVDPVREIFYVCKTAPVGDLLRHMGVVAKHKPSLVRKTDKGEEAPSRNED